MVGLFSTGVEPWKKDGVASSQGVERQEAIDWVKTLGAGGATNLHDAVMSAFDDLDADTIIILSDGEPTAGALTDGGAIRDAVARRNKNRDIEIHCIAVGGSLQILEWLADDSGGSYVQYN